MRTPTERMADGAEGWVGESSVPVGGRFRGIRENKFPLPYCRLD